MVLHLQVAVDETSESLDFPLAGQVAWRFTYVGPDGVISERRACMERFFYGSLTPGGREEWLVSGYDLDLQERQIFALAADRMQNPRPLKPEH